MFTWTLCHRESWSRVETSERSRLGRKMQVRSFSGHFGPKPSRIPYQWPEQPENEHMSNSRLQLQCQQYIVANFLYFYCKITLININISASHLDSVDTKRHDLVALDNLQSHDQLSRSGTAFTHKNNII